MELNELIETIKSKLMELGSTEIIVTNGFRSLKDCKFRVLALKDGGRLGPVIRTTIGKEMLDEIRRKFYEAYPEFKDDNPMIRCMLCGIKYKSGGTCWRNIPCNKGIILEMI